jgi:hypothetical protein
MGISIGNCFFLIVYSSLQFPEFPVWISKILTQRKVILSYPIHNAKTIFPV